MESSRTRESNKSFHLSPDAINAIGSSAARRSLEKPSPDTDLATGKQSTPNMPGKRFSHTRSASTKPANEPNTYSTRSSGKKRAKDAVDTPEVPPSKRGRSGAKAKLKITGLQATDPDDEDAVMDAEAVLRGSATPEAEDDDAAEEPTIEGELVLGPGTLIRHINHLAYTERKQPAAMGACLTILDASKKIDFAFKYDKNNQPVFGPRGDHLRDIPDVPDKVSTELEDIWYQILLQDMCGATYTDLLHRLNSALPASKFSNRIMNYRLRQSKFSISPNDREISKGSLVVAGKLTLDQLRYNTCWNFSKARQQMRQPRRHDDEGWMPLPCPAGDFDTSNSYIKSVLAEIDRCKKEADKSGSTNWLKVYEKEQRDKKAKRHARKNSNTFDDDTIKVADADDTATSGAEDSTHAVSIAVEDEASDVEDATEVTSTAPGGIKIRVRNTPSASTPTGVKLNVNTAATTLDGMVRAMINEQLGDVDSASSAQRSTAGARQSSRANGEITALKAEQAGLVKRVDELEKELRAVKKAARDQQKWASEAFRDLKSEVEKLKWR